MPIVTQPPSGKQAGSYHHQPFNSAPPSTFTCGRTSKMTRGRKKDLTIPPTRALVQQRDYRARRAQYVASLEERCRRVEEENTQLRSDLAAARAGQGTSTTIFNSQTAHASSELMHNLVVASASLARFQQLAFSESYHPVSNIRTQAESSNHHLSQNSITNVLRPASFPSPAPSPPYTYSTSNSLPTRDYNPLRKKRLHREDSPHSIRSHPDDLANSKPHSRSSSLGSECCGGFMDCRNLVEREDDDMSEDDNSSISRTSPLRTMSEHVTPTSRDHTRDPC